MRSRSDSEPTRMPTTVSDMRYVATELHAGEIYARRRVVCGGSRVGDRVAQGGDVEDASAVRHEPALVERRAGVEDERARRLGGGDPVDRRPAVAPCGIAGAREDDG